MPRAWFDAEILPELLKRQLLGPTRTAQGDGEWASCFWILGWMQRLVPASARVSDSHVSLCPPPGCVWTSTQSVAAVPAQAELQRRGVDWGSLAAEVAGLRDECSVLRHGDGAVTSRVVVVHGDSHMGSESASVATQAGHALFLSERSL
eukprot:SAG11_NODE_1208_length_5521_cov_4.088528_4_plen_149_part_00